MGTVTVSGAETGREAAPHRGGGGCEAARFWTHTEAHRLLPLSQQRPCTLPVPVLLQTPVLLKAGDGDARARIASVEI